MSEVPRQPKQTRDRARELRTHMTGPERRLWSMLRRRTLGLRFNRQVPIGPFVADFLCRQKALVVELDGLSHVGRVSEDAERTAYLEREGFRVIRVSNDAVLHDLESVGAYILREAQRLPDVSRSNAGPPPRPSPRAPGSGGGGEAKSP